MVLVVEMAVGADSNICLTLWAVVLAITWMTLGRVAIYL